MTEAIRTERTVFELAPLGVATGHRDGRPLVLLVDSYDQSRLALAALLRDAGLQVLEVRNGVEGLKLARQRRPDLVIADLWPFFSASIQMLERLREDSITAHTPVLVLTSAISAQHQARAARWGCAGYLQKPCEPMRVMDEVGRLLAAPGARQAPGQDV